MKLRPLRLLFDLETNALPNVHTVHVLAIKDLDTGEIHRFRQNDDEDTIAEGIALLNRATYLTGHNIISFDLPVLYKLYGDIFDPVAQIRDTLVMARMLFADVREHDFRLWKRGQLDGKLIGRQGLEAWGQRLGSPKDDFSDRQKARARELGITDKEAINDWVWHRWTQEMEDYCVQDLETNYALWMKIERTPWSDVATILEHQISDLMERVKANGFPFDIDGAHVLEADLRETHDELSAKAIEHFAEWWKPKKWNRRDKANKAGSKYEPRAEFGEDDSRMHWGEVFVPKRTMKWKPELVMEKGGDKTEGCAYCPVELTSFNPNSRPQIIDRLKTVYDWVPQAFTEAGTPTVDDEVLRELAHTIPICEELAELFYYKKRLGQLVDGQNGWIGKAEATGKIHSTINPGGTVTNRASHSDPNIAQVPRVVFKKLYQFDPETGEPVYDTDGAQLLGLPVLNKETGEYVLDDDGKIKTKSQLMKGRAGDHGWDCRNLYYVPEGWVLMGADQKGIELRALGHVLAAFDGGEYAQIVVNGDPHGRHQAAMELDSRDTAKTFLYAMLYGAGDFKLGIIADPALANYPPKAKNLGKQLRERLMAKIPAFGAAVKAVQREARRGSVSALDGRELFVRSKHAAFNTKLQGIGATISKKWCVLFEQMMEDEGFIHGWNGDFAILAWVHDELQVAVRDEPHIREAAERCIKQAALDAGDCFNFTVPVEVEVKFGENWAQTH